MLSAKTCQNVLEITFAFCSIDVRQCIFYVDSRYLPYCLRRYAISAHEFNVYIIILFADNIGIGRSLSLQVYLFVYYLFLTVAVAWSVETLLSNPAARVRFPEGVRNFNFCPGIGCLSFVVSGGGPGIVLTIHSGRPALVYLSIADVTRNDS